MLTNAGVGLQHLPRPGRDPLARGRHPRRLGPVRLRPRPRRAASSGRPATSRSAGPPTTTRSIFSADKATFRRLDGAIETAAGGHRLAREPGRDPPGHADQPRHPPPRARADQLRRGRPRSPTAADLAPPGLRQAVPGDRVGRRLRGPCSAGAGRGRTEQPPIWAVHVVATDGHDGERPGRVRDRPRPVPRPGPDARRPRGARPGRDPLGDDRRRCSTRSSASAAGSGSSRAASAVVAFTTAVADSRDEAPGAGRPVPRDRAPSPGPSSWPGPTARSSTATGTGRPRTPTCSSGSASHLIYAGSALRADPAVLAANRQGQPGLWRLRDLRRQADRPGPRSPTSTRSPLARQLLDAHAYLRLKGLEFDLVLLDERADRATSTSCTSSCSTWSAAATPATWSTSPAASSSARRRTIAEDDQILLQAAARVVLVGDRGPLAGQLDRIERPPTLPDPLAADRAPADLARRRPVGRPPTCCSPTASAGSRPTAANTAILVRGPARPDVRRNGKADRPSRRPGRSCRRPPGSTSSPTPTFGFLASEAGLGLHLGRQQPDEPPDPLEQRPGLRPARRGRLPPRRGDRRGLVARPRCPSRRPSRPSSATARATRSIERTAHGLDHELTAVRPARRPGQARSA